MVPVKPLRRHRADDTVTKAIARILRADLVVTDDIGLLPVAHDTAEGLYRLVDAAYEKRSIAISSNLHPAGFDELMPRPWPPPTSTGSCTTPTSAKPAATASASPKPSPARGESLALTTNLDPVVATAQWADPMATTGQFSWPPAGRFHDRPRAETNGP